MFKLIAAQASKSAASLNAIQKCSKRMNRNCRPLKSVNYCGSTKETAWFKFESSTFGLRNLSVKVYDIILPTICKYNLVVPDFARHVHNGRNGGVFFFVHMYMYIDQQ